MVVGDNGIIAKAQTAKKETDAAQDAENNQLSQYENKMDELLGARGTITTEELNHILYPNKSKQITAFTDTTTDQTYTVERDGWLYISAGRKGEGYSSFFYRNDLEILQCLGSYGANGNRYSINAIYIPVKKGDIIKKKQNNTSYIYSVFLYYYE